MYASVRSWWGSRTEGSPPNHAAVSSSTAPPARFPTNSPAGFPLQAPDPAREPPEELSASRPVTSDTAARSRGRKQRAHQEMAPATGKRLWGLPQEAGRLLRYRFGVYSWLGPSAWRPKAGTRAFHHRFGDEIWSIEPTDLPPRNCAYQPLERPDLSPAAVWPIYC